jgi:hypothetical protein
MPFLLATFERQVKAIRQEGSRAGAGFSRGWTPAAGGLILFETHPSEPHARKNHGNGLSPTDKKFNFLTYIKAQPSSSG